MKATVWAKTETLLLIFALVNNGEQQETRRDMKNVFGWIHTQDVVIKRLQPPDWSPKATDRKSLNVISVQEFYLMQLLLRHRPGRY